MGEFQSLLSFAGLFLLFIIVTLMLGVQERKRSRSKLLLSLRQGFGKPSSKKTEPERYAQIPQYFLHHAKGFRIDDITWNDLDLDQLFHRMDSTCSASGEEYLYYLLRTPSIRGQDLAFAQEKYEWFSGGAHEEERIRIQEILTKLGHAGRYSLYDYIDFTSALGERSNVPHYIAAAAPFAAFALMFVHTGIGIIALLLVFAFNLVSYFKEKGVIAPYYQVFNYILRLLDCAQSLEKENCPAFKEETEEIPGLLKSFSSFRRGSSFLLGSSAGESDLFGIILEYIRILFHLDLIKFNSMLAQLRGRQKEIDALLTITGRIDALISIVSWRETLPYYAVPDLSQESAYSVRDLYHPLLAEPVSNDMEALRPILLTGSNASGKSTFLKAAALCALLSQTVGIAPAKSYRGPCYRIFTSMALRDSLQDGESYFIVEIKSLRRILEAAQDRQIQNPQIQDLQTQDPHIQNAQKQDRQTQDPQIQNAQIQDRQTQDPQIQNAETAADKLQIQKPAEDAGDIRTQDPGTAVLESSNPVLCCIDEVLRGTNTVERIAASAEILRCFASTKTLCFAATHDLELTGLLADVYDNYHFSEKIVDGDVRFSYKIMPGPSTSCNAIALLNALGYDKSIVEKARERADRFLEDGSWQKN